MKYYPAFVAKGLKKKVIAQIGKSVSRLAAENRRAAQAPPLRHRRPISWH
jgi:hypothetical protein